MTVQTKKWHEKVLNKKGATLISVIMAFVVVMMLMSSIVYIARQDVLETVSQELRLRTFYIASAGIELSYAALMNPDYEPKNFQIALDTLEENGNTPISDTIQVSDIGVADVTLKIVTVDEENWLQITSVGRLTDETTTVTTTLRINEANSNQMVREKFGY